MGLSDCECGGFIALGPTASNRCDKCGKGVFSPSSSDSAERRAEYWKAELNAANVRIAELEEFARDIAENWDCDDDAHKYGTRCRACSALEILNKQ